MKHLKITTRLAISIVFLLGALLFLVHAFYTTKQMQVIELEQELDGVTFLTQVTKTAEALSHYRIAIFRAGAGETEYVADVAQQRAQVQRQMDVLMQLYSQYRTRFKFSPKELERRNREKILFNELDMLWKSVALEDYAAIPIQNYNELFRRLMQLSDHVSETSGLVADEDLTSYALATAITEHVTEVIMRTLGNESDGYISVVKGEPASRIAQLYSWDYGSFVQRDNLRLVKRNIDASAFYNIEKTDKLRELDSTLQEALERYIAFGGAYAQVRIDLGEGKVVNHERYVTNGLGFTAAMFDLWYVGAQKLEYLLKIRIREAAEEANRALVITLAAVLLAFGFFVYVTRGIVRSLKDIEEAMDRVANGELDLQVPYLDNGDEIGSMARTLERFRQSYWWLRD